VSKTAARTALRRMREQVLATGTPLADGEDTDEVWHNTVYRLSRARRAETLADLPGVPLFFGRLDYRPGAVFDDGAGPEGDLVYIGRRHVRDAAGRPLVVDWRLVTTAAGVAPRPGLTSLPYGSIVSGITRPVPRGPGLFVRGRHRAGRRFAMTAQTFEDAAWLRAADWCPR